MGRNSESQLSAWELNWENVGPPAWLVQFVLAEMIIELLCWTTNFPLVCRINRAVQNPSLLSADGRFWGNRGWKVSLLGSRVTPTTVMEKCCSYY